MTSKISFFLLIAVLGFTSCITTHNMSSFQIEILKPAIFAMPENIDTIAIFKRDFYQSDTITFKYLDVDNKILITDSFIHYHDLSNNCVSALANYLDNEGYFLKVINFKDSMNYLFSKEDSLTYYPELLKKLSVDACIFLDYFQLDDQLTNNSGYYFKNNIIDQFPEFRNSTKLESVGANLLWTVSFKGDTSIYICKQPDE
jgi:hypothetical protein